MCRQVSRPGRLHVCVRLYIIQQRTSNSFIRCHVIRLSVKACLEEFSVVVLLSADHSKNWPQKYESSQACVHQ